MDRRDQLSFHTSLPWELRTLVRRSNLSPTWREVCQEGLLCMGHMRQLSFRTSLPWERHSNHSFVI